MSVQKQSVSFTDTAIAFAKELVEAGEYPTVSAAVSGELRQHARPRAGAAGRADPCARISL